MQATRTISVALEIGCVTLILSDTSQHDGNHRQVQDHDPGKAI